MSGIALQVIEQVDGAIYKIADAVPPKELSNVVQLEPRYLRGLRYREHPPSDEARIKFGFAYPSVGEVWAYWSARMQQGDLFDHSRQRDMLRDFGRAR